MAWSVSSEISCTITRPADTTPYASGDLVANDTTAGSVVMASWQFSSVAGLWLREVRLYRSQASITNSDFRLWLHNDSAVTFTNGDNGALSIASSTLAITSVAAAVELPSSDAKLLTGAGSVQIATFDRGLIALPNTPYGFLEARAAYTPASAEVFTIVLRGEPYP